MEPPGPAGEPPEEPAEPEEEPPSEMWGLDPLFSAFARLYVSDILRMKESTQVPGIFLYNQHPVFKVDVMGTLVYKKERDDFICYGVDDSTGVINCLCWKCDKEEEKEEVSGGAASDGTATLFNAVSALKKLKGSQEERCRLEIGEILRVRGTLKTSREKRDIVACSYYKVNDPMMALQISWLTEVLQLYREFYDKRLDLSELEKGSVVLRASVRIQTFLEQNNISTFRPYEVKHLLLPLISPAHQEPSTSTDPEPSVAPYVDPEPDPRSNAPDPSPDHGLHQLLKETLRSLAGHGIIYRQVKSQDDVYKVTSKDQNLRMAVRDVIGEDGRREQYAVKGLHVLHILSAVRQRFNLDVSKAALEVVLQSLECSSDIISTSDYHYSAF